MWRSALLGALALSLEGIDFTSAFTASLTGASNVGPGLNAVGPVENFAFFSAPAKFFLSFLMLAGRLGKPAHPAASLPQLLAEELRSLLS